MLIEQTVFNFHEVGEKSLEEIKNECLVSFAVNLKIALTTKDLHTRQFWADRHTKNDGSIGEGSLANYKIFGDLFGSKIKYNSKNVVFEETIYNGLNKPWSLQRTCMDVYGLEYVESENVDTSSYYKYRSDGLTITCDSCCMEAVGDKRDNHKEWLKHFYNSFSPGEFPFMTITIIRLGNKDHYFYRIHR